MAFLVFAGCANLSKQPDASPSAAPQVAATDPALKDAPPTTSDLSDNGSDLKAIPFSVNRQVLQWIDYFQGQGRPHMERYLSRSTRYMPIMKKILHEQGLPEDLIYIALIESGFSSTAHSSASAVGYWQFIKGTGRRYGLKIDSYVDERRDFVKSTLAAADYFKGLYDLFGAWYLAIASYNVGEGRVKNVITKYKTRDFWQLARENKLPAETVNYVPKFIAARLIAKEPEKYGFTDIEYMPPLEFSEAEFTTSIDIRKLAKEMNLEYDDLRDLNPSYKRGVAFEKNGKLTLRVPKGTEAQALAAAQAAGADSKRKYVAEEDYGYYRIRRGDTIATIAKKFGTSQRNIRALNRMGSGSRLIAGHRLRVPAENIGGLSGQDSAEKEPSKQQREKASTPSLAMKAGDQVGRRFARRSGEPKPASDVVETVGKSASKGEAHSPKIHVVQKGDTLIEIAHQYRVSLKELARHNRIARRGKISVGTRLEIP